VSTYIVDVTTNSTEKLTNPNPGSDELASLAGTDKCETSGRHPGLIPMAVLKRNRIMETEKTTGHSSPSEALSSITTALPMTAGTIINHMIACLKWKKGIDPSLTDDVMK
jgi:hypothetical protein